MTALSTLAAGREAADRPALIAAGRTLTWSELAALCARELDRLGEGPALTVLTPRRTIEDVVRILARIELGRPFVPLHPRLSESERDAAVAAAQARDVPRGTLAVVLTSGTTGAPKPVVLSRDAFVASARASESNLGWQDDDRWLLAMPLAHVGGLSIVTRCLLARRCVVLAPEGPFDARAIADQIARDRVTLASLVPTMLHRLLELDPPWHPPAHLRALLLGGAPASPTLLARADDRDIPVLTTYGLTEACSQVTTQRYGTRNRGQLGAGPPLPGITLRIAHGEIQLRFEKHPPNCFQRDTPQGNNQRVSGDTVSLTDDGFLRTGDLGELDADGNLHVRGRLSDVVITGGENVDPVEVERVIEACPGVRAVCVVGVPDEAWGERVVALVVADGASEPDLDAWARAQLAPHKRPRIFRFVDDLPQTPSGKVDRSAAKLMVCCDPR